VLSSFRTGTVTGRRKVGRPRMRWLEDVENDLCDEKANKTEEWTSSVKEAEVLKGPRVKEKVSELYKDAFCCVLN
jgi:hypothetical protein